MQNRDDAQIAIPGCLSKSEQPLAPEASPER